MWRKISCTTSSASAGCFTRRDTNDRRRPWKSSQTPCESVFSCAAFIGIHKWQLHPAHPNHKQLISQMAHSKSSFHRKSLIKVRLRSVAQELRYIPCLRRAPPGSPRRPPSHTQDLAQESHRVRALARTASRLSCAQSNYCLRKPNNGKNEPTANITAEKMSVSQATFSRLWATTANELPKL